MVISKHLNVEQTQQKLAIDRGSTFVEDIVGFISLFGIKFCIFVPFFCSRWVCCEKIPEIVVSVMSNLKVNAKMAYILSLCWVKLKG